MAVVIVDKTKCIIGIFGRETQWIDKSTVARGKNYFAKG